MKKADFLPRKKRKKNFQKTTNYHQILTLNPLNLTFVYLKGDYFFSS